jgi:hypothetical protein
MTRVAPRISSVVPDVNPELDQLCADMMAHDPNARPRDMSVVRERLVRIFPEIEGGRLPMRSLTNEAGYEATLSADQSGQIKLQVEAALARAGLSGVGLAVPRSAGTQSALAVAPAGEEEEPIDDVAGVPKRSGALVGVVAVLALVAGVGAVAFVKMHGAAPPPAAGGFGLVQSTVAAPAVPVATTPTPAAAPPPATPPPPSVAAQPVSAPIAPAPKPVAPSTHAQSAKPPKATPPAAAPATPADKPEKEDVRPVGGTTESKEF